MCCMNYRLVVFNMDNTLYPEASNFYIAKYVAAVDQNFSVDEFLKKEEELRVKKRELREQGRIDELPKLEDEYTSLLMFRKNLTDEDISVVCEGIPFYSGIAETIDAIKKCGAKVALITTGPEPIARRCKDCYDFDYVHATGWEFIDGRFTGNEMNDQWNKGKVLERYQKEHGISSADTVVVEYSDWNVCDRAGLVVLLNPHQSIFDMGQKIKDSNVVYISSSNMRDILPHIIE